MRGSGADAKPALLRVDGDSTIALIALDRVKYSKVTLPNPPAADGARSQRADVITDMAFADGKLMIAGLSNEEFLLMSNNSRGVMKIPTDAFGTAAPITEPVKTETAGVPYEKITSMTGVEQMDLLDGQRSIVLARTSSGLNLAAVPLP